MTNFQSLGLSLSIINRCDYVLPTAIQQSAIPLVLAGKDIMACAATGTGKTAAFALPLVQQLLHQFDKNTATQNTYGRSPQILVLTPTRELAQQVNDSFVIFSQHSLTSLAVYGGANINPQRKIIAQGVDILVATPGRLFDLISQDFLSLLDIHYFVVDEADRMLDLGFVNDIKKIKRLLPCKHQSLFFSATYSEEIKKLAQSLLTKPELINIDDKHSQPKIEQVIYQVDKRRKAELLAELIGKNNWRQVLAFVNTKEMAEHLCQELKLDGIKAEAFHGDKTQGARNRSLLTFKEGSLQILVATDIAARGLDITALPIVINVELPENPEDYVHRIGRTGRAGLIGKAITLLSPQDKIQITEIEKLINTQIATEVIKGYELGAPLPERYRQVHNEKTIKPNSGNRKKSRFSAMKTSSTKSVFGKRNKSVKN